MGETSFTFRKLDDPAGLAADWRALEERADCAFFLSWDWIGCWLATVETEVFVLQGCAGGRIVALGLLCPVRRKRFGLFMDDSLYLNQTGDPQADRIAIEYNGMLLDREAPKDAAQESLRALVEGDGPPWNQLFLRGLSDSFTATLVASGYRARLRSQSPTAGVDLESLRRAGRGYLEQRSANTRAQIRRSIRRYEERGAVRLDAAGDVAQGLEFFRDMDVFHRRYWNGRGGPGAFSSPFAAAFHRRLIETVLPRGHVELLRLSAGDNAIGYLYNFIYRNTVSYYASGFVYEQDNRLKPGLVAHTMCIERHLTEGRDRYDFMAGAARYKKSLGETGPDISAYVLERPGAKLIVKNGLRRIRDFARR
ncbi:MAG: GNAT family N-acetyltransferase [Alphaproteobacteria bacterium]|nr:GNAT family N-acetyltransferase [Alphaproteobacteria bacterium]